MENGHLRRVSLRPQAKLETQAADCEPPAHQAYRWVRRPSLGSGDGLLCDAETLRELADIRVLLDVPDVAREEVNSYFVRHGLEDLFDRLDEN